MKKISKSIGAKKIGEHIAAWVRGLVWTAMILGCAWASAQSNLILSSGHDRIASMSGAAAQGEAAAQNADTSKDELFAGTEVFAKNATHVTEITMDPDSLGMVGGQDEHKAHNMVLNVVRTYEYDKPGMYNMADVDAFRGKLNTGDWHCSVHERDLKTGESTDICSKRRTDGLREQAIVSVEPRELTFIHRIWRGSGPGSSELGFFPMIPGVGPMTMMAMTNPDAYINMEMGMHGMMLNVRPDMMIRLDGLNDMKVHPLTDQQIKVLNDQLKNMKVKPFDQQQMKDLNRQMKDLNKQMKDLKVMPDMPAMPVVPDTQQAPQAPIAPPAPGAPSAPQPE